MDVVGQVILCILTADFLTGLFHWWEDTYGLPHWPLIGSIIVEPNILHHEKPTAFITMCGAVSRIYQPALLMTAFGVGFWLCGWLTWQVVLTLSLTSLGNEFHAWAHQRSNIVIRTLQETGLLISVHQHGRHHKRPYDRYFCTVTCWLNPVLELIRFWRILEWLIARLGVKPKRCTEARRGY